MGSALMGSLRISCFFDRDFLATLVNLLLAYQNCQGVPFSPIRQKPLLLQRPRLVLTPFVGNQGEDGYIRLTRANDEKTYVDR